MKTTIKNYSSKKCPDSFFGEINNNNDQWDWIILHQQRSNLLSTPSSIPTIIKHKKRKTKTAKIIIILESPHSDEFKQNGNPICPANGTTGANFFEYFCGILNASLINNKVCTNSSNELKEFLKKNNPIEVWIVNSIQKQCSLGIKPINNIIKESNWIDEWCSSNNNLITRCEDIIGDMKKQSNYFIINLCTKGEYIPMKELVEKEFLNIPSVKPLYCKGPHPSSWSRIRQIEFN